MRKLSGLLIALCLLQASCGKVEETGEKTTPAIGVTTIDVHVDALIDSFRVLGEIEVFDGTSLFSKVKGTLVDYTVKKGDLVQKGDVIAHVDRDEVGYKYQLAPVVSTLTGTVGDLPLAIGKEVGLDTPIALIVNLETLKGVMHVSEKYFGKIKLGQPAILHVDAYPGESFSGVVSEISPMIDSKTRTFLMGVTVNGGQAKLLPGMFVKADIILDEIDDAVVLPEEAVISSEHGFFVYTMQGDRAVKKAVSIGKRIPGKVQIVTGVDIDEKVVVSGHHKINDGSQIFAIEKKNQGI